MPIGGLKDAAGWLESYSRFSEERFDRLDDYLPELQLEGKKRKMSTKNDMTTESPELELVITRVFDAPRGLVFKAWTQPEHLARWWGPRGYNLPSCEIDLHPGGSYRFQMRSPEGDINWWHGVVREIVEPERIVWTCSINKADGTSISAETLLTVTLEDYAGKTRLTMHQGIFESIAVRDAHSNGWTDAFGRLAEHLASA
jgi:uncharacterized protein YndB with AHSA1/START domain